MDSEAGRNMVCNPLLRRLSSHGGPPASEECAVVLRKLLSIFGHLGLPVAKEKLERAWTSWDSRWTQGH